MPELGNLRMGQTASMSFLILSVVSAVLPVLVLEPLTEKIGRVKTHAGCLAIMTLGYIGLYFLGSTLGALYTLMAVVGIGWASIISLPFAIMSQQAEKTEMGLYMGLFNLSVVLPQLVVSLGISLAVSRAEDPSIIFVISAVALALSTVAWMRVRED
jgi:MFS family permease